MILWALLIAFALLICFFAGVGLHAWREPQRRGGYLPLERIPGMRPGDTEGYDFPVPTPEVLESLMARERRYRGGGLR